LNLLCWCIQCWDTFVVLVYTVLRYICCVGVYSVEIHLLCWCIQCWDTPDDGQWTCPKHVEYFIKEIWEIVHLAGFHYRNISRCMVLCQTSCFTRVYVSLGRLWFSTVVHDIFVPLSGTCFMSPTWRREFCVGSEIFGKTCSFFVLYIYYMCGIIFNITKFQFIYV